MSNKLLCKNRLLKHADAHCFAHFKDFDKGMAVLRCVGRVFRYLDIPQLLFIYYISE